jgi:hypothetical protein
MELGGFWLIGEFQGEFMGMPFKGRSIDGYDQLKKKYVSLWVDSFSSFPMVSEGNFAGKVLTLTGEAPNMEGKIVKYRTTSEVKDKDTMVMQMFEGDSKEPNMVITYKRRK